MSLGVYRKGKALYADSMDAAERLARAMEPLQEAADRMAEQREELAVFADPAQLRRERAKAAKRRDRGKAGRRSNGRHRLEPGTASRMAGSSGGTTRAYREPST
jgi:hypothetical protein